MKPLIQAGRPNCKLVLFIVSTLTKMCWSELSYYHLYSSSPFLCTDDLLVVCN